MTSRSRASRREAARARESAARRWLVPGVAAGIVLIAAIVAILATQGAPETSSVRPSSSSGPIAAGSTTTIQGASLLPLTDPVTDPARGQPIPTVTGADFDGRPTSIARDNRPKVILFLAHWCPHCQREVPLVESWVGGGGLPAGVDLVSVATSIDPARPNYPPDAWLAREGWTAPVIVDADNRVADAFGVNSFPFWVFVDSEGRVAARTSGELTIEQLDGLLGNTAG